MKLTEKQFVETLTGGRSAFVLGVYRDHDSKIVEDLNKLTKRHADKLPRCTAKLIGKTIYFSNGWEMRLNVGRKKTYHKLVNDVGMEFIMRKIPIVMDTGEELTRDYVVFYIPQKDKTELAQKNLSKVRERLVADKIKMGKVYALAYEKPLLFYLEHSVEEATEIIKAEAGVI